MKLYTFYSSENKVVYATAIDGKSYFFYSGFESAEDAKEAIMGDTTGMQRTLLKIGLCGEWSEIE